MSTARTITNEYPAACLDVSTDDLDTDDICTWLSDRAREHVLRWLLAHADDGVVWGRFGGDRLVTSRAAPAGAAVAHQSEALRASTLQQARLFGESGELLLWREDGDGPFRARLITGADSRDAARWERSFDECHLLDAPPPRPSSPRASSSPRLRLRHYLDGPRVAASRLVGIDPEP